MTMTDVAHGIEQVLYLDEPGLQFASAQHAFDPHDGLAMFGPFSQGQPSHPQTPAYMVIGAPQGVRAMRGWSEAMNQSFAVPEVRKHRLWPPYPGFEVAFGSRWSPEPAAYYELDQTKLLEASRKRDSHDRCFAVVEQFMEAFEKARKQDVKIAVAICVVPDEVRTNCRTESRVSDATDVGISREQKKSRKRGQMELFETFDPEQYKLSPDFRRQLKARTMRYDIPLQIIQESTLRLSDTAEFGERRLTRLSDRMWNLGTALYYKSGGKPWKLNTAREGVCYVGIAFRRASDSPKTACCAAQMFLDSGDGIVFLGEYGPWYSPDNNQFHLSHSAAKQLLEGVLKTYSDLDGRPLKEVFLHCRSSISKDEFAGYQEACPTGCKIVGIRVRSDGYGPRLFRDSKMPVIRGTFLKTSERSGLLYAAGFKPRIATYDGWETPVPLRIDIQHGEAPIELVACDILGLTKLNYNACKLGDSQPVTVGFSDAVGEILISNPTVTDRRPNFKFYI
ncbi:hypothetical protein [Fontivita pretiosa]|uniref:hypothetical protein n=1 Tax=Fontivita pretiosa TaxID=2989684 RepID=UPI003D1736D9